MVYSLAFIKMDDFVFLYRYILVHGNWGTWSVYTSCSKSCGIGKRSRSRSCSNPAPSRGGLKCLLWDTSDRRDEAETQFGRCNSKSCPGKDILIFAILI